MGRWRGRGSRTGRTQFVSFAAGISQELKGRLPLLCTASSSPAPSLLLSSALSLTRTSLTGVAGRGGEFKDAKDRIGEKDCGEQDSPG